MLTFDVREKHQAAILNTGLPALGEEHETSVRLADGTVQNKTVLVCLTQMDNQRAKALGIELQNSEAINVTVSLSVIGYRPRPGMNFPIDGKVWQVHGRPAMSGDICRITLKRSTS